MPMTDIETKTKLVFPEGFRPPSPEVAVLLTTLISYVDSDGQSVSYGQDNVVHGRFVSRRIRKPRPIFSSSFYFEKPVELPDGIFLLGGLDGSDGTRLIDGVKYDLYRSYDLFYDLSKGFVVRKAQTAVPIDFLDFYGEGKITLWERNMTKSGIRKLSRKLQQNA